MARSAAAKALPTARGADRKRLLDEEIADRLRESILKGELEAGERLTELSLANQWQVSQATIRAALKLLQGEGLVEYRKRRGTFVTSISEADVLEIYTLREMLEAFAARRAAQRVTAHGRKSLERIMRNMRAAARTGDRRRMLELDFEFHRAIVNMSGHRRLLEIYAKLESQTRLFLTMTDVLHHDLEDAIAHHEPLGNAILAGDHQRAFELASHHCERDAVELVRALFHKT
ncbi:MAG: GntR family transcriptional regulator [Hyphomicrobiaceae bacterium]